ncbi:hypothetical protein Kisp01_67760 [Kineosporia sp. NBRC 101677]|uniref:type IV secretory system conjugative DNA transfer family protein n=1 Tax=Kineosporia sp. NBRC 101677 TaxID=3032197 RepID=UPI0024A31155|nr:type IV secretion system DNA-binding domain-containing protein [Kineosporia sp. NBRC 101677]GLY19762.1 hypothetical protein Kisp01_67760 [Kineosporia sp. NBRC 101677]
MIVETRFAPPSSAEVPRPSDPVGERLDQWRESISGVVLWAQAHPGRSVVLGVLTGILLALLLVLSLNLLRRWRTWRHRRLVDGAKEIVLYLPLEVDPAGAHLWWSQVATLLRHLPRRRPWLGPAHVSMELRRVGVRLEIVVWVPGVLDAQAFAAALRAAWDGADTRIRDAGPAIAVQAGASGGREGTLAQAGLWLQTRRADWMPFAVQEGPSIDPMRALLEQGARLQRNETSCVQFCVRLASYRAESRLRRGASGGRSDAFGAGSVGLRAMETGLTWSARALMVAAEAAFTVLWMILDAVIPGPSGGARSVSSRSSSVRSGSASPGLYGPNGSRTSGPVLDPVATRQRRDAVEKAAIGPWLEVSVRVVVARAPGQRRTSPLDEGAGGSAQVTGARDGAGHAVTQSVPGPARRTWWPARGARRAGADPAAQAAVSLKARAMADALGVHNATNQFAGRDLHEPLEAVNRRFMGRPFVLGLPELARLAAVPTGLAVLGLERAGARMVPPPAEVLSGGRDVKVLGRSNLGDQAVGLSVTDARQHVHVVGSTGVGKSTLIARMVLADVHAGRGVVVIDPKGDLALDILDRLPAGALPRLTLIDPGQQEHGGGSARFNPLEAGRHNPEVAVDTVVSIFRNIFRDYWGPRMDETLRACCLTLMRSDRNRLDVIPRLLTDTALRRELTANVADNPGLQDFWNRFETWMLSGAVEQHTGSARARLRQVLMRPFATHTFAGDTSTFDMGQVLDGGILICRLPSGEMGSETARLVGSLIVSLVWQAATARAALPESQRRDAALYVDEAHTMLNLDTSLEDMLPQARAFHLSMVLAHQNLDQFDTAGQQALAANARTKVFFTASPRDARQMAQHTEPYLSERDLSRLSAYTAAVRVLAGNRVAQPFTMSTVPLGQIAPGARMRWRQHVAATAPAPQSSPGPSIRSPQASHDGQPW